MLNAGIFGSARVASGPVTYETAVLADGPLTYFPLGEAAAPPVDQMGAITPVSYAGLTFGSTGVGDRATSVDMAGTTGAYGLRLPYTSFGSSFTAFTFEILAAMDTYTTADRVIWSLNVIGLSQTTGDILGASVGGTSVGSTYTVPNPNSVHHWAITWDGTTARFYDNGAEVRSVAKSGSITPTEDITIGGQTAATNRNLDGRFGGFAYYTSALSAARILAHAQAAGVA